LRGGSDLKRLMCCSVHLSIFQTSTPTTASTSSFAPRRRCLVRAQRPSSTGLRVISDVSVPALLSNLRKSTVELQAHCMVGC
jgi:hypothetical protein